MSECPTEYVAQLAAEDEKRDLGRVLEIIDVINADEKQCQGVAEALASAILDSPWPKKRRLLRLMKRLRAPYAAASIQFIAKKMFPNEMLRVIGAEPNVYEQELSTFLTIFESLRPNDRAAAHQMLLEAKPYFPQAWPIDRLLSHFFDPERKM